MVIISAAICSTNRVLLSRQFTDISKSRVESLLSAFSKLVDLKKQQSYVETDSVRYVYQPMEKYFLLLITNKSSNIVEDLDTLQLLSNIVKDKCPQISQREIFEKSFEILFAFDEAISLGYKEGLSVDQINSLLEMDSHEENLQEMIWKTKVEDANAFRKKKAQLITKKKKENDGKYAGGISSKDILPGVRIDTNSGSDNEGGKKGSESFKREESDSDEDDEKKNDKKVEKNDDKNDVSDESDDEAEKKKEKKKKEEKKSQPLTLSFNQKNKPSNSMLSEMMETGEVENDSEDEKVEEEKVEEKKEVVQEKISVKCSEEISASLKREGGLEKMDVKGILFLSVNDKKTDKVRLNLNKDYEQGFLLNTNPKIDKNSFTKDGVLKLKNEKKGFPTKSALKVVQWRLQKANSALLPLSVTCWPSETENGMSCSVEFESKSGIILEDVVIEIPLPSNKLKVDNVEKGSYKHDKKNNTLKWHLESLESSSGSIDFEVKGGEENSFFPINISFSSKSTISKIQVESVVEVESGNAVKFSSESELKTSEYKIE